MEMPETIYSLVPREPAVRVKPPMYKSKHDPHCLLAGSTFGTHGTTQPMGAAVMKKEAYGTFGRSLEVMRNDPSNFLKKGERLQANPVPKPGETGGSAFAYSSGRKPPVPKRNDSPVTGIASKANFITANAVDTILAMPRGTRPPDINYLEKEDYGKVPKYLQQVKDEILRENTMIDTFVREQMGIEGVDNTERLEELQEHERQQLLHSLKAKWDTVNKKYQFMAHMVNLDTFGKLRRKEQMERQLKDLEADIQKLEKNPVLVRA